MVDSKEEKYPDFVCFHFLDANGELKSMEEFGPNVPKFIKEGLNVDGSSIAGMSKIEKSDLKLIPEKDSFLKVKVGDFESYRILCKSMTDQGLPHPNDPRQIFQKVIDKAHNMGIEPYMFSEIEFYIVDKETGKTSDNAGYCSLPPEDVSLDFRHDLGKACLDCKMAVKRIHHENGPGQNEIELNLTPCMKNADDTVLAMWILRLLADKRKQKIIFSPKPFTGLAGNGLHHHILIRDLKTGENLMMNKEFKGDPSNEACFDQRLSTMCKQFIAGLLKYADDITSVFAGSKETFERLKPGFEAPIFKAWDFSNRTALVRVPKTSIEMSRCEYRGGDLSWSVHLYGAVLLAAGLKGIEENLSCPEKANFNVEKCSQEELEKHKISPVPSSFEQTTAILTGSKFLKEALGEEMVHHLIQRNKKIMNAMHCPNCNPSHEH